MNPEIIKMRKYNNQFSIGIPKDVGLDLQKQHFEKFLLHCECGVITLTPTALLNRNGERTIGIAKEENSKKV